MIGSKTIGVEASTNAADIIIAKVGTGGLEKISHTGDSTLQSPFNQDTEEYRYRGSNPDNYVTFNEETWRIIGVFPTENASGNIENRVKIIRNESIGDYMWDDGSTISSVSNVVNSNILLTRLVIPNINNYGVIQLAPPIISGNNNWAKPSLLNAYLNNSYYNSLTMNAQSMIDDAKYYLGGYIIDTNITKDLMYSYERKITGSDYYYQSNPNHVLSKIALMYLSDYGYSADQNCEHILEDYDAFDCTNNNWLYLGDDEWTLSQIALDYYSAVVISSDGGLTLLMQVDWVYAVRPVLYLSSDVMITGGSGTSSDPYILSK